EEGVVYLLDQHRVRQLAPDGTVTTLAGGANADYIDETGPAARFDSPLGLALDPYGNLVVADTNNQRIRLIRFNEDDSTSVILLAGLDEGPGYREGKMYQARFNYPRGLAVGGDFLFVVDSKNNQIRRIDFYK
ncbi:MAG: gluconolaconase, partial [Candidatus Sericytochromatia bacterium]